MVKKSFGRWSGRRFSHGVQSCQDNLDAAERHMSEASEDTAAGAPSGTKGRRARSSTPMLPLGPAAALPPETETPPRLYLVDGSSYVYRAFHAIPFLSTSKGVPTNAVYGFMTMMLKLLRED